MGRGGRGGFEFPASHTLYFRFLPPSLMVRASVCFLYCEKLCNVAKIYFLLLPAPVPRLPVARLLPSLLPPPVNFPPPITPGFLPPPPPPDHCRVLAEKLPEPQFSVRYGRCPLQRLSRQGQCCPTRARVGKLTQLVCENDKTTVLLNLGDN